MLLLHVIFGFFFLQIPVRSEEMLESTDNEALEVLIDQIIAVENMTEISNGTDNNGRRCRQKMDKVVMQIMDQNFNDTTPKIEENIINSTKAILVNELLPEMSKKLSDQIRNEINAVERRFEATITQKNQQISALETKVNALEAQNIIALKGRIQDIESTLNTRVIFSVARKGHLNNPPLGQKITYTDVIANEGQGMDPNTGVFDVPVSGIYSFSFSALTERNGWNGNDISVKVFKNSGYQFSIHSGMNPLEKSYENLSLSWLMSLTKDDKIYLRMNGGGKTLHVKDEYPVVFNGYLLMAK